MERSLRVRVLLLYALLAAITALAYLALGAASAEYPVLFGIGLLAYVLGLKHGVDADHILAIDNTTRKMMHDGKRPITNGLFFSLGHSTIVVVMVILVVLASKSIFYAVYGYKDLLGLVGTVVSASFLVIIAVLNLFILRQIYKEYRESMKRGGGGKETMPKGFMSRIFSRLFKSIHSPWQLYPVGVLLGLGFDTATEVTLIGISAAEASSNIPIAYILILPVMFAVGMTMVDSTDSVFMVRAYAWALADRTKRLFYNMVITAISVSIALIVAVIETWQLLPGVPAVIENFDITEAGFGIVAIFVILFVVAYLYSRARRVAKR